MLSSANFQFDARTHTYTVDGVIVPGVTRVLGDLSADVYRAVSLDVLERASELGREVHRCTALLDRDRLKHDSMDSRVARRVSAWVIAKRELGFEATGIEHRQVGLIDGMKYGMTVDRVGKANRLETVIELKCTRAILPHHHLQTAGYSAGLQFGKATVDPLVCFIARQRFIVQLLDTGRPLIKQADSKSDFDAFRSLLYVHYWRAKHSKFYGEKTYGDDQET